MNEEIKEIYLSDLQWIKTHDNMGGVKGNIIFKNNLSFEDFSKICDTTFYILCNKDYITNLQQEVQKKEAMYDSLAVDYRLAQEENERLKEELENKCWDEASVRADILLEQDDYKSRVEKAVEYFKYQLENLDFYEDTKARMLCAMGITLLQNGSDEE